MHRIKWFFVSICAAFSDFSSSQMMLLRHFLGDWGPVNCSSDNHGLLVNKKIWVLCYVQGASLYRIVQNLMPLWAWVVWKSSSAYFPKGDRDFLYAMIKFQKSLECDLPLSFLGQNYNERSKASERLLINRYIIYAVWYLAVSRRSDAPVGAALTIDLNGRVPRLASAALFTALLWSHVRKLITTTCFRLDFKLNSCYFNFQNYNKTMWIFCLPCCIFQDPSFCSYQQNSIRRCFFPYGKSHPSRLRTIFSYLKVTQLYGDLL